MTVADLMDAVFSEWAKADSFTRGRSRWHLSPGDYDRLSEYAQEQQRERERADDMCGRPFRGPYPLPPMVRTTVQDMLTGLPVVKDSTVKDGHPELRIGETP